MDNDTFYDRYWMQSDRKIGYAGEMAFSFIENGSRVLEIGCGECSLLRRLKEEKDCDVYGVDISKIALKNSGSRRVVVGDIEKSFFIGSKFDYIVGLDVLEHFFEPAKFLKNIKGRSNRFIFSSPNACYWRSRLHLLRGDVRQMNAFKNGQHLQYWNYPDYMGMFEKCGYKMVSEKSIAGVPVVGRLSHNLSSRLAMISKNMFYMNFIHLWE